MERFSVGLEERKNLLKLKKDIEQFLKKHECNLKSFKGIRNISVADLEDILLRVENRLGENITLSKPTGNILEVFRKYNLNPENWVSSFSWY